jgi:hypothetical protein
MYGNTGDPPFCRDCPRNNSVKSPVVVIDFVGVTVCVTVCVAEIELVTVGVTVCVAEIELVLVDDTVPLGELDDVNDEVIDCDGVLEFVTLDDLVNTLLVE